MQVAQLAGEVVQDGGGQHARVGRQILRCPVLASEREARLVVADDLGEAIEGRALG